MNDRLTRIIAWTLAILAHGALLITLGSMTLAGGRPSKPGVQEMTLNLAAQAPAPKAAPQPKPEPHHAPKPKPKPRPEPVVKAKPKPKPVPRETPKPEPRPAPQVAQKEPEEKTPDNSEEAATQSQPQGARGIAGDPGKGAHAKGNHDNLHDRYMAKVRNLIDRHKQYPSRARMRRQQGIVEISFVINANGRAENVAVHKSSGSRILDRAATQLVQRLHFDRPPVELDTIPVPVTAPLDYNLSNS
ncbi:ferric siderophore transport system periplasmic binding protein [Alcanivorax hongdengensis A-11-3]|uniref:Protein TonB n=1 Tax=Alcanivorax hongdengensis A-11-3 TaxID=1177179 RepID=L0WIY4_9GAMM|nr:energy transducer TonB [Alcanivorax hongdengensis]EKF75805.1 ferric siderophore transport system periplasmic binding protein [Alcanivorax hongdengensis A-11-3]